MNFHYVYCILFIIYGNPNLYFLTKQKMKINNYIVAQLALNGAFIGQTTEVFIIFFIISAPTTYINYLALIF